MSEGGSAPPPDDLIDGLQYIDGDWTVTGYENYSNEIIVLTGNLTVTGTGVLEFANVTLRMNATIDDGQYNIEIRDGGHFYLNDTDSSNLTMSDSSVLTNSETNSYGFLAQVNATAVFEMRNSIVRNCGLLGNQGDAEKSGLLLRSDNIIIENSEIYDCANGIVADSADPLIVNNTIFNNKYNGIFFHSETEPDHGYNLTFTNNRIEGNSLVGIHLKGEFIDAAFTNNIVAHNNGGIIIVSDTTANISFENNDVLSNTDEGGVGIWGDPDVTTIRADFNGNNISENSGRPPIRLGVKFDEEPARNVYANISNNTIWKDGGGVDGSVYAFATENIHINLSFNEIFTPYTQNGVHIGKLTTEYNGHPGTRNVSADIYHNNITNFAAGALRICSAKLLFTNITHNHIYNNNGLMNCGAITVGWFKAGTGYTTPDNATVIIKNNLVEGIADSGAFAIKAVYNLNTSFENNTLIDTNGWGLKLGWVSAEGNPLVDPWALPTRNVRAKIANNIITDGRGPGIWIYSSNGSQVFKNNVSLRTGSISSTTIPGDGIRVQMSRERTLVFNNSITDCDAVGLRMYDSRNATFFDNNIDNCGYGLGLDYYSKHNIIFNNTIDKLSNQYGFYISPTALNHTIPDNNTVNGKWLRYYYDLYGTPVSHLKVENHDVQEPLMANLGQIIIANSSYVDIVNNYVTNGSAGISLLHVDNSSVSDNTVKDSSLSSSLCIMIASVHNDVFDNVLINNRYGMGLFSSSVNNSFWSNNITKGSTQTGLYLDPSGTTWNNDIPANNTVEGTPLRYFYQESDTVLEDLTIETPFMTNYGQIILVECSDFTLDNIVLKSGTRGIYMNSIDEGLITNSDISENGQNIYCRNSVNLTVANTITSLGTNNYYQYYVDNITLDNCTLLNGTNSIALVSSSAYISNSTISEAQVTALNLTSTSSMIVLNTTFNKTLVSVSSGSELIVKWYLDVLVEYNNNSLEGALIVVSNETGSIFNYSTGANGLMKDLVLEEYLNTTGNITMFTPYHINVTKSGYDSFNITIPLESSTYIQAELGDRMPPEMTIGPTIEPLIVGTSTDIVWLNATLDDTELGDSNIAQAEWFSNLTVPSISNGSGNPLDPVDGIFDNVNESISTAIDISSWAKGQYHIWVHGADQLGNWNDWASVEMMINDDEGPAISQGPTIEPTIIRTSMTTIWLTATIDDAGTGNSIITDMEMDFQQAPESIVDLPILAEVTVLDGAFDEWTETITLSIDMSTWVAGEYTLQVRGVDAFNNTGAWANVSFPVIDNEPPSSPLGLTVTDPGLDGKLELSWDANTESDLGGYLVYRSRQSGSSYQAIASINQGTTNWTDEGLQNGLTYYYVVTAFDTAETPNESPYSDEAFGIPSAGQSAFLIILLIGLIITVLIIIALVYIFIIKKPPKEKESATITEADPN